MTSKQNIFPQKRPLAGKTEHTSKLNPLYLVLWSFLPILLFIIADSFWGLEWGLIVGIATGLIEFIYSLAKEKRVEKFILADVGLLILMGIISYFLDNPIFIKLKPAILEFMLLIIILISIFSPYNIVWLMMSRMTRYIKSDLIKPQFNQMMKFIALLLIVHIVLTSFSAFYSNKVIYAFISGPLLYILTGIFLLFYWIAKKYFKYKSIPAKEFLDIIGDNGKIIGQASRDQVHRNPNLLHPAVHMHIYNSNGEILLQKRSDSKDMFPGKWDTAVGGHVISGELPDNAILREAKEELGLEDIIPERYMIYRYQDDTQSELMHVYLINLDREYKPDDNEISEIAFFKYEEILELKKTEEITPTAFIELSHIFENTDLKSFIKKEKSKKKKK
ncbi:MAG: NUDIX domain-containing protein [Candidatus Coatesbacteria bacterium]|nr:NUDIX domain-containing protein [Candidatus Coatesbacteria bacterium]